MTKFEDKFRLIVQFGKFPVVAVTRGAVGTEFTIAMHGIKVKADLAVQADIRVGDLLTLYTEVLADDKPRSDPLN